MSTKMVKRVGGTNRSMYITKKVALVIGIQTALVMPAFAENQCCVDWSKLNLSAQQNQQVQQLEAQWQQDYSQIKPAIAEEQRKLQRLLESHNADPVELMAVQQSLQRKKDQLNQAATANYLRKRQVLNENQQHQLEQMIRQRIAEKQKDMHPNVQSNEMPNRLQDLMQRVLNRKDPEVR
ncbi:MAG: hypothetical protein IT343_08490 [Candidatus Melainabacteria bacterium]|nr:hypothetical protein [Candidatus Melainabacteria bacterium]